MPAATGLAVCILDRSKASTAAFTLALLRESRGSWREVDRVRESLSVDPQKYQPSEDSAEVALAIEEIGPGRYAATVDMEATSEGNWGPGVDNPGSQVTDGVLRWYAVADASLTEILWQRYGGSAEAEYQGEYTELDVTRDTGTTGGYYDFTLETTTSMWDSIEYGRSSPREHTKSSSLRWNAAKKRFE